MDKNKVVVLFRSKYGSTKQYAEWIAMEVDGDLFDAEKFDFRTISQYDTVVYGGPLYAIGILGISLIKNNLKKISDKKVIVFSVGASPAHEEALSAVKRNNFTEEMKEKVNFFHLRGGFNYGKLNPYDKFLMYILKLKLKHKKHKKENELTDDEKGMLASYKHPVNWVNKKSIIPIIECIKNNKL